MCERKAHVLLWMIHGEYLGDKMKITDFIECLKLCEETYNCISVLMSLLSCAKHEHYTQKWMTENGW